MSAATAVRHAPDHGADRPSRTASWPALGTTAQLAVTDPAALADAAAAAARIVDHVDRTCSRFRADSDLARANAAAGRWVDVDPLLVLAVGAAVDVAGLTDGLVDPTLGRVLAAAGYDRDLALVRGGTHDASTVRLRPGRPRPGAWREIGIDASGRIRVPDGVALDLGASGKSLAADLVADDVSAAFGVGVVVSLGGDVAVAGPAPATPDGLGWSVRVEGEPTSLSASSDAPCVLVADGGLATSSTRRRTWRRGDVTVHHLLDPATGRPVPTTWAEVTVRAASCLHANAASTASMVRGPAAAAWLEANHLPALLRRPDGSLSGTCGWPDVPSATATSGSSS